MAVVMQHNPYSVATPVDNTTSSARTSAARSVHTPGPVRMEGSLDAALPVGSAATSASFAAAPLADGFGWSAEAGTSAYHGYGVEGAVRVGAWGSPLLANQAIGCDGIDEMMPLMDAPESRDAKATAILAMRGTLLDRSRTAAGSTFLQGLLSDGESDRESQAAAAVLIWDELQPSMADLLVDPHGCYVMLALVQRLPPDYVGQLLWAIEADEQLALRLCTSTLHPRRFVQFILESVDGNFLSRTMVANCAAVSVTQQGCILIQRSMDNLTCPQTKTALLEAVCDMAPSFATHPFGNYVLQHAIEIGDRALVSARVGPALLIDGRAVACSCDKFASNVIEKCLFHFSPEAQHALVACIFSSGQETLLRMLQDSYGNYIVQSSIALAMAGDVAIINDALRPVLGRTPYGHKLVSRLDRRMAAVGAQPRAASLMLGSATPPVQAVVGRRGGSLGSSVSTVACAAEPVAEAVGALPAPRSKGSRKTSIPAGELAW